MPSVYSALSDTDLVKKTSDNDFEAFSELFERYKPLISSRVSAFSLNNISEKEDLEQEGFIALYFAARTYKDTLSASFKTYANACIYNQIISHSRKLKSKKATISSSQLDISDMELPDSSEFQRPEYALEMKESYVLKSKKLEEITESFSPLERKVLISHLSGVKRDEVEQKLGLTLKTYDNALHRVRKKLSKLQQN